MYTLKLRKGGGGGNFILYGRTDRQTHTHTHRSTYRGGAHLDRVGYVRTNQTQLCTITKLMAT